MTFIASMNRALFVFLWDVSEAIASNKVTLEGAVLLLDQPVLW